MTQTRAMIGRRMLWSGRTSGHWSRATSTRPRAHRLSLAAGQQRRNHQNSSASAPQKPIQRKLNPPASTRPPPLTFPDRKSSNSTFQHLFKLGKSYIKFYKDGLKAILENHRLLRRALELTPVDDRPSIFRPHHVPRTFSRADWVLLWRVRHDILRLPLFGLILVVFGEFTVLFVIYVDGVIPNTCRMPKQVLRAAQRAEERRSVAFEELKRQYPIGILGQDVTQDVARRHVLRSLDLTSSLWDKLGMMPPWTWQLKGRLRMAFLEGDDEKLLDHGPLQLETHELTIACKERGIDTLGRSEAELRTLVGDWLRLTASSDIIERRRRMATLLLTRPEQWPQQRNFFLPNLVL